MRCAPALFLLSAIPALTAAAGVQEFQADQAGWLLAAGAVSGGGVTGLIDFDDASLSIGSQLPIAADRYASHPAGPSLIGVPDALGSGAPIMYRPSNSDSINGIVPVSGSNVLQLTSAAVRNGIMEISFAEPVSAIGGFFIDLELTPSLATTGIWLDGVLYDYAGALGNGTQHFIGIVSDTPFTVARIHLASGITPPGDGLGLDNLQYVTWIPAPGSLAVLGIAAIPTRRRR
jgi:hypothetical protein